MKKYLAAAFVLFALFFAQTSDVLASCGPNLTIDLQKQSRDYFTDGQVTVLQNFLKDRGFFQSDVTGFFGNDTYSAVRGYQIANGISPASGFVGALTRASINTELCTSTPQGEVLGDTTSVVPIPVPSSITIISPNGGEQFPTKGRLRVEWQSSFISNRAQVSIGVRGYGSFTIMGEDGREHPVTYKDFSLKSTRNDGSETVRYDLPPGKYKMFIKTQTGNTTSTVVHDFGDQTFDVGISEPTVRAVAVYGSQESSDQLVVKQGESFSVIAKASNLDGISPGYNSGNFSASWKFDSILDGMCSNDDFRLIKVSRGWKITCTPNKIGESNTYAELYVNNKTYKSNNIKIKVVANASSLIKVGLPAGGTYETVPLDYLLAQDGSKVKNSKPFKWNEFTLSVDDTIPINWTGYKISEADLLSGKTVISLVNEKDGKIGTIKPVMVSGTVRWVSGLITLGDCNFIRRAEGCAEFGKQMVVPDGRYSIAVMSTSDNAQGKSGTFELTSIGRKINTVQVGASKYVGKPYIESLNETIDVETCSVDIKPSNKFNTGTLFEDGKVISVGYGVTGPVSTIVGKVYKFIAEFRHNSPAKVEVTLPLCINPTTPLPAPTLSESYVIDQIKKDATMVKGALESYRADNGAYPPAEMPLSTLVSSKYLGKYLSSTPAFSVEGITSFSANRADAVYYYGRSEQGLKCGKGGLSTSFVAESTDLPYILLFNATPDSAEKGYYGPAKYFNRAWLSKRDAHPGHWSYCL